MYNCYNLTGLSGQKTSLATKCFHLGFDIMLDSSMKPHLLEVKPGGRVCVPFPSQVNTKPQLLPLPLDMSVNVPMVEEMTSLVGFHLPPATVSSDRARAAVARIFKVLQRQIGDWDKN